MSEGPGMIRILSVDDHPLLRKGIAAVVNAELDMKLVAEASNGEEAIEKFRLHRPDITLMDLQMPGLNGIEAMNRILAEFPDARIIVLTTYNGDAQVLRALRAGARAYILKGHDHERRGKFEQADRRPAFRRRGHCQEPHHQYPVQAWRQRSGSRGDHRPQARNHRELIIQTS